MSNQNTNQTDELKACGAALIAAERTRQLEEWSHGHDLEHDECEIAEAAFACIKSYLCGDGKYWPNRFEDAWGLGRKHNKNPERLLVVAGALIAAELDRINGTINTHHTEQSAELLDKLAEALRRLIRLHYDQGTASGDGLESVQQAESALSAYDAAKKK